MTSDDRRSKQVSGGQRRVRGGVVRRGQGSEDNMRRKRRLESFQPLFPALVIRV